MEAEREVEKAKTQGRGERRRWRREEEVEANAEVEVEAREGHIVKSSKIVVSIKIIIRIINTRLPNKQLVHDQKWDIQA